MGLLNRKKIYYLTLIAGYLIVFSSCTITKYADSSYSLMEESQNASFLVKIKKQNKHWQAQFYPQSTNGKELVMEGTFLTKQLEMRDGIFKTYRYSKRTEEEPQKILVGEEAYQNNLKHGVSKLYKPNGDLHQIANYKLGKLDGKRTRYFSYPDRINEVMSFRNGQRQDTFVSYHGNGKVKMQGSYSLDKQNGIWEAFFEDGKSYLYSEWSFDTPNGIHKEWYRSGKLKIEKSYSGGKLEGTWQMYYQNGKKMLLMTYENDVSDGYSSSWYQNGNKKTSGMYEAGEKYGIWEFFDEKGVLELRKRYENGEGTVIYVRDTTADNATAKQQLDVYDFVDQEAEPKIGIDAFQKEIEKYVEEHYPPRAKRASIQGRIFIEFIVELDGSISNLKVLKGIEASCDLVAISALKSVGKWNPAKKDKKNVKQRMRVPIKFMLR